MVIPIYLVFVPPTIFYKEMVASAKRNRRNEKNFYVSKKSIVTSYGKQTSRGIFYYSTAHVVFRSTS